MEEPAHDEVAWSLMDFGPHSFSVDTSTAEARAKVVVDYLINEAFKEARTRSWSRDQSRARSTGHRLTGPETPADLMGSLYL